MSLTGQIVLEWLEKWPDLPKKQLARMIYNADNNHLVFTSIEHIRSLIRMYKGQNGYSNREGVKKRKFYDEQIQST